MSLKDIFCQDKAISLLQRARFADKLSSSYIFAGNDGIGKHKTAVEWAKLLLCENPIEENNFADSCGQCRSCKMAEANSHPDLQLVYKELLKFTEKGKSKKTPVQMPIDVIREFLVEKVSVKPTHSAKKIFLVNEAEKLNAFSQNCLLKVLEEPPAFCTIILITSRLDNLLPTTKSRCQTIRFSPVSEDRIINKLTQLGLTAEKATYFARLSQASIGQACSWAKLENEETQLYQKKKELIHLLATYKYPDSLEMAEKFIQAGKQISAIWSKLEPDTSKSDIKRRTSKFLIWIIISAMYDVMKIEMTGLEKIINSDQKQQIEALKNRFTPEQASENISQLYKSLNWLEASVNEKLIFEQMLLNLSDFDTINV